MFSTRLRISLPLAAFVATGVFAVSAGAHGGGQARGAHCRAPRVTGLTLATARRALARAGCRVVVRDHQPTTGTINPLTPEPQQLVAAETPAAGRLAARAVTISLKPLCMQSADPGPSLREPLVTAGPTELLSGIYLDGGPLVSSPRCRKGVPSAGTITVAESGSGRVVASQTVASGQLASIALAPGTYLLTGTFGDAAANNRPIAPPQSVTIPAGHSVREDVIANIS
jgi:hypothetical protein